MKNEDGAAGHRLEDRVAVLEALIAKLIAENFDSVKEYADRLTLTKDQREIANRIIGA